MPTAWERLLFKSFITWEQKAQKDSWMAVQLNEMLSLRLGSPGQIIVLQTTPDSMPEL